MGKRNFQTTLKKISNLNLSIIPWRGGTKKKKTGRLEPNTGNLKDWEEINIMQRLETVTNVNYSCQGQEKWKHARGEKAKVGVVIH